MFISNGGGSPGSSIRGQNGYQDALLNVRNREDQTGATNKVNSTIVEMTRLDKWNNLEEFDPPSIDRIVTAGRQGQRRALSDQNKLNLNQQQYMKSGRRREVSAGNEEETIDYEDIPRIA